VARLGNLDKGVSGQPYFAAWMSMAMWQHVEWWNAFRTAESTMDTGECCFGCTLAVLMLPRIVGGMEMIGYMYVSADMCPK
jgi:hypothetical protein